MTVFARGLLAINGLLFAGYGIACLFAPSLPADYSGIVLPNASAVTEMVAMYGGLQTGLGALLCWSALKVERVRFGLMVLAALVGSLAFGRAVGLLVNGATTYNLVAVVYESAVALLAAWALGAGRTGDAVPA